MRGLYSLMLYTSFTSTASYGTSRELPAPCACGALLRRRLLALSLHRAAVKLQDLQDVHCTRVAAKQLLWQADVRLLWDIRIRLSLSSQLSTPLPHQGWAPGVCRPPGTRHSAARVWRRGARRARARAPPGRRWSAAMRQTCWTAPRPRCSQGRASPAARPACEFNHVCRSD
jgi:hypothetical protein